MTICQHLLDFRKATASGGNDTGPNCVEIAFATGTASGPAGHCVDAGVATADIHAPCTPETCKAPGVQPGDTVVRDSKDNETGPWVVFRPEEWRDYVTAVLEGSRESVNGQYVIRDPRTSVILRFTVPEWEAFVDGCAKGEFTYDAVSTSA